MKTPRIGLALGGGGARGLAHLGVLTVLAETGLEIAVVSGTSFGALVGAVYAVTRDSDVTTRRVMALLQSSLFRRVGTAIQRSTHGMALTRLSLITPKAYADLIASCIEDTTIERLPIRFAAVSTDLIGGCEVVLRTGSLRRAVAASSALPGVFPPVRSGGYLLVDGGWADVVPVAAARALGADVVIAVHAAEDPDRHEPLRTGLDVLRRANDISRRFLGAHGLREADVVIQPEVGRIAWTAFGRAEECIARGEAAARRSLGAIRTCLAGRPTRQMRRSRA